MSTFQEIIDEVKWSLARPDLRDRIKLGCIQAVHECHNLGFFVKDLRTQQVEDLISEGYAEFLDPQTSLRLRVDIGSAPALWPNLSIKFNKFRKLHKVAIYSDVLRSNLVFDDFKNRATDAQFDEFKRFFANYYMTLGTSQLDITFGTTPEFTDLIYFWLPLDGDGTDPATSSMDDSFLVQDYPEIVVSHAIAKLAVLTGQSDLRTEQLNMWNVLHDRLYTNEDQV